MTAPEIQALVQLFAGRLINTALEGIVLAGLVWLALRLLGRLNSAARFAIWLSALLAIVALPFFAGTHGFATHSSTPPSGSLPSEFTLPVAWAFYLCGAWAAVSSLLILRLCVGLWRVLRLRGQCAEVDFTTL